MNNKLTQLFQQENKNLLNVYCTAGYPKLSSTTEVLFALQENGVDMIEVGMPYSDPIADVLLFNKAIWLQLKTE